MFTSEELETICRGLTPAVPGLRKQILETPFADLCYQSRHMEMPVQVPVGYWKHQRESISPKTRVCRAADAPESLPGSSFCQRISDDYVWDSLFIYGEAEHPDEVDYVFGHKDEKGLYLRLLVSPVRELGGISYPPGLDEQPCSSDIRPINGIAVYHAFRDARYGPHEIVWKEGNVVMMLLMKPAIWSDTEWFIKYMTKVLSDHLIPFH